MLYSRTYQYLLCPRNAVSILTNLSMGFTPALEICEAADADRVPQFVEKPRFSDAGLADHGDKLAASAARFVPATSQRRKLHLAPDERRSVVAGSETMRLITE